MSPYAMRIGLLLLVVSCGAPSSTAEVRPHPADDRPPPSAEVSPAEPTPAPSEPAPTAPAAFPTGPLLVECAGTPTYTFGPFDTVCDTAADCAIVQHALDCCGSHAAHGIRNTEASRFDAEEARCGATIAGCRCEAAPTRADDGSSQRRTPPSLDCIAHRCVTWFAR